MRLAASHVPRTPPCFSSASMGAVQVVQQLCKLALGGFFETADKDVVESGLALCWQNGAGDLAQAAFGAVAGHGVADFLGAGVAHADRAVAVGAVIGLQQKPGGGGAFAFGGAQKVAAFG